MIFCTTFLPRTATHTWTQNTMIFCNFPSPHSHAYVLARFLSQKSVHSVYELYGRRTTFSLKSYYRELTTLSLTPPGPIINCSQMLDLSPPPLVDYKFKSFKLTMVHGQVVCWTSAFLTGLSWLIRKWTVYGSVSVFGVHILGWSLFILDEKKIYIFGRATS